MSASSLGLGLGLALALVVAACGGVDYAYVPEGASIRPDGVATTTVDIPPELPQGEVRVESRGVAKLGVARGQAVPAIHVRLSVSNNSDERPWTIDTREQLLEIRGEGQSRPVFASSDHDGMPIVTVTRRQQRIIDLFYPLPSTISSDDELPGFELLWQVNTGERVVAERTPFGRVSLEPTYYTAAAPGWGPLWWHDPYYSSNVFVHYRPVIYRTPARDGGWRASSQTATREPPRR